MNINKPKFWDTKHQTFFSIFLLPISYFLLLLIFIKKFFITKKKFNVPIICVGNIYIGGTGKTPLAIKIFEFFKEKKNPVIIKKNYKNQKDEIELLNKYCKTILCKERSEGIKKAIEKKFDLIILDDGYQDLSFNKKLNIICFNTRQKIGNGQTIPAGPLRENLASLKYCNIVLINGSKDLNFENKLKKSNSDLKFFYFKYFFEKIDQFKNKKLIAFAGIGNPDNFFSLMKEHHLNVVEELSFPDHHDYTEKEIKNLFNLEEKYKAKLVTTEKDYLRISQYGRKRFGVLPIKIKFEDENKFIREVTEVIK